MAVVRIPDLSLERPAAAGGPARRRHRGRREAGQRRARSLRSADGAGADALIAASPRTDLFNPNAIRASAGTIFAVPLAAGTVGRGPRLAPRARPPDRHGARRRRTALHRRRPAAVRWPSCSARRPTASTTTWSGPDVEPVAIPMHGVADSLNVSISAAVLLYEARRQRDPTRTRGAD